MNQKNLLGKTTEVGNCDGGGNKNNQKCMKPQIEILKLETRKRKFQLL